MSREKNKPTAVVDIECYRDYFLVMFKRTDTGNTRFYEMYDDMPLNVGELRTVMANYRTVSFNGNNYDMPMLALALTGASCQVLKEASDSIIVGNLRSWEFERIRDIKIPKAWDHIDLIEVAFGQGSLKLYGGRLHSKRLQDLPIDPSASIAPTDREVLRQYCANDLQTTIDLWNHLTPQIELRENMSASHGLDLRSKSDAQIAEAIIRDKVSGLLGYRVGKPDIPPGTTFRYQPPVWLSFGSATLQQVLSDVLASNFVISVDGGVVMPEALEGRTVPIGNSVYRMGIGGLHSSEQCQGLVSDQSAVLIDRDVASFYPAIILNNRLSPLHLKQDDAFLRVYKGLVDNRLAAKKRGDNVVANALKITINGGYGKFGSRYSALYSPHLMIQVTLTGQLSLLMLIERIEAAGIRVVSGNTDGIVIHCPRNREADLQSAINWWEKLTGFVTEETRYAALFSRDVNNYVAVKEGGGTKGKGAFAPVSISKNPDNTIVNDAVKAYLTDGTSIDLTIRMCTDIRKFVTVRTVRGGGVQITRTTYNDKLTPGQKRDQLLASGWYQSTPGALTKGKFSSLTEDGDFDVEAAYRKHCGEDSVRYLGKVVRFYIGHTSSGPLFYMTKNKSGGRNKVPGSDGAVPVMELPEKLPSDIDYDFYIREARKVLNEIGATPERVGKLLYGQAAELFM